MSDSIWSEAMELASDGHHEEAAIRYAQVGLARLLEANYDVHQATEGLTFFLYTASYDSLAGNYDRAHKTIELVTPFFEELYETTNDECLKGLVYEWLGDLQFYMENDDCLGYYSKAREYFERNAFDDWMSWGAVPPFDNAYGAMSDFLANEGIEFDDYSLKFIERIDTKTALYHELCNTR